MGRYIHWAMPEDNGLGVFCLTTNEHKATSESKDLSKWSMRPLLSISYWKA